MAAIKLSIFFFTFSTLLGAYHARHLHDGCIYQSFVPRPPVKTAAVIQMVTGEEPQLTPSPPPSSSQEDTNHGQDNPNAPPSQGKTDYGGEYLEGRPSPRRPPPDGQTIYSVVNPKTRLPTKVAPPQVQTGYGGDKLEGSPSPIGPVPEGERINGRDNPNAPPPPKVATSRGQTTYGGGNPNSNSHTMYGGAGVSKKKLADFLALLIPSYDKSTVYGGDYLNAQPSPKGGPSESEVVYPKALPSPQLTPSRGQRYGGDDPTTPLNPGLNDADKRGILFESICGNGGSSCADSSSTFDVQGNRIPLRAPSFSSDIQIKQDDDQLLSIASHWLLSYTTRLFNNW